MKNYKYGLFFFLFASVFLISFNINHIDKAAANSNENISKDFGNLSTNLENIITLPLPQACVFNDGENPKIDPDECEEISNNDESLGNDNIFFTLNSPQSFDSYTCTLQEQNGIVISSFDCFISPNVAEAQFEGLEDGDYVFTATASRTINTNNTLTPDVTENAASPPFNFRIGIGSDGGFADEGGFGDASPAIALDTGSFIEKSRFETLLINEKLGFINLEKKLKNNETINTTSLACLGVERNDETHFDDRIKYVEFNCNRLLIFATTSPTSTFVSNISKQISPYSNDIHIYKVNNALFNGINGHLVSCGAIDREFAGEEDGNIIEINPVSCRDVFIAYEISP